MQKKIAPCGSWNSPLTSDLIVAQAIALGDVRIDGGTVYWLEGRPQEQGRNVVVRADGQALTPAPFNARTRVHEYGGGAWQVAGGELVFSHFADSRLYRQSGPDAVPRPLTPEPPRPHGLRYADGLIDGKRNRWIGVREDHLGEGEAVNTIVAVDFDGTAGAGRVVASGRDFFSSPRLSPRGDMLIWLAWDHPNMPWNGTTLYLVGLGSDGLPLSAPQVVAGGPSESIFQPEWSPDGRIVFMSDRSGWWNPYIHDLETGETHPLVTMPAEFGVAQWVFGMATYAFAGPDRLVCSYQEGGLARLAVLDLASRTLKPIEMPFTDIAFVRAEGDTVAFLGGSPRIPTSVVVLDLRTGTHRVLKQSTDILRQETPRIADYLTTVEPVEFPTANGKTAFALFYPPHNPDYAAPAGEAPPVLVKVHGGPTGSASSTLSLRNQFWTSRGIAVLDVNYGGSSGFGREYRERLWGTWGVVDVEDCINGVKALAARGLVDAARAVITGGSAGGYTALAALAFHDFFAGGASHYGVSDVAALARDTHKFESRYLDWLIGPYPEKEALYRERSPLFRAGHIAKPVIFFQGDEDMVVPQNQTDAMVEALRRNGTKVGYVLFAGEQHGFRKAGNIQRSLDAELYFYAIEVFGTSLTF